MNFPILFMATAYYGKLEGPRPKPARKGHFSTFAGLEKYVADRERTLSASDQDYEIHVFAFYADPVCPEIVAERADPNGQLSRFDSKCQEMWGSTTEDWKDLNGV